MVINRTLRTRTGTNTYLVRNMFLVPHITVFFFLWSTYSCIPIYALLNTLGHTEYPAISSNDGKSTAVFISDIRTYTRSRAGGTWAGERGGATILCAVILYRRSGPVACRSSCNLALPFPNLMEEGVKNMSLVLFHFVRVSSWRINGSFFSFLKFSFDTNHQSSGIKPRVPQARLSSRHLVLNCTIERLLLYYVRVMLCDHHTHTIWGGRGWGGARGGATVCVCL